jgi:hypothetical protein
MMSAPRIENHSNMVNMILRPVTHRSLLWAANDFEL